MVAMSSAMQVLGGRYELRSLVATGGMGQVWRAHDQRLGRPVAVKVLRSEYAGEPEFLARFRAEARHAAMLGHRNVVAVFDYGETTAADGEALAYLVMELVPGESLAAVRRRLGALPPEQVLEVVAQAAAGLGAAHEMGIVHRDVKPANLLLRPDGSVAVTDFGIAWSAESVALTRTGQVIGTAHYLSPEQARGGAAVPASDVYALGMVAYELLAGHRAFEGASSVAVALSQIQDEPDELPASVPAPVRELVAAMLVKDVAGRLPDGDAVVAAAARARVATGDEPTELLDLVPPPGVTALLEPALVPATTAAASTSTSATSSTTSPVGRRRRGLLLAGVLAALLLVGGGTAVLLGVGGSSAPAGAAPTSTSAGPTPVTLDAANYLGRPLDEVTAELTALGLTVVAQESAGDGSDAGLVTAVDPAGTPLTTGSSVTVRYGSAAPTTEPTPEPTTEAPTQAPTQAPATQVSTQAPVTEAPAPTTADAPAGPGNGGPGNGGPGNGNGNGPGNGGPGNGNGPGRGWSGRLSRPDHALRPPGGGPARHHRPPARWPGSARSRGCWRRRR